MGNQASLKNFITGKLFFFAFGVTFYSSDLDGRQNCTQLSQKHEEMHIKARLRHQRNIQWVSNLAGQGIKS